MHEVDLRADVVVRAIVIEKITFTCRFLHGLQPFLLFLCGFRVFVASDCIAMNYNLHGWLETRC